MKEIGETSVKRGRGSGLSREPLLIKRRRERPGRIAENLAVPLIRRLTTPAAWPAKGFGKAVY
jgi:hypothetical protein